MGVSDSSEITAVRRHEGDYGRSQGESNPTPETFFSSVLAAWWFPLAIGLVLVLLLARFDGAVDQIKVSGVLRGDLRRELEAVQQFGQGTFSVLIGLVIFLLDPARRRWLLGWAVSAAVLGVVVTGMKMLIGRVRPRMIDPYDPLLFLGPFGKYPWTTKAGTIELLSPLQIGKSGVSDLWSMPSSHTAFAVLSAAILARMYPKIAPVVWGLAATVGVCRLIFDAHYLTDVIAGACVAVAVMRLVLPRIVPEACRGGRAKADGFRA